MRQMSKLIKMEKQMLKESGLLETALEAMHRLLLVLEKVAMLHVFTIPACAPIGNAGVTLAAVLRYTVLRFPDMSNLSSVTPSP